MPRLEYRLLDKDNDYPLLYYYEDIPAAEIAVRFNADYLIKDGEVLEKTSNAVEPPNYVIYTAKASHEFLFTSPTGEYQYALVEIREYNDYSSSYPIITTVDVADLSQLIILFSSHYITVLDEEWEKVSSEIDEDRKVYVLYVQKSFYED